MMAGGRVTNHDAPFWISMREAERQIIEFYLDAADGHVVNASVLMGMDKAWVYRRMKKLGIPKRNEKAKPEPKKDPPVPERLHLKLVVDDDDPEPDSDPDPDTEPVEAENEPENHESIDGGEGESPAPDAG